MPKINNGLRETPIDPRTFPLGAIVGHTENPNSLPSNYIVGQPLIIKQQSETDMCSAFALTSVSEDQEGVVLDPRFNFGVTKAISGDPDEWGADLLSACKSATVKHGGGFLPVSDKLIVTQGMSQKTRDDAAHGAYLTSPNVWAARKFAKRSYFEISGDFDVFNKMKSALWQTRGEKRSILTGCRWYSQWTGVKGGVIDKIPEHDQWYGHAVKCFGWSGEYLIFQLSNGESIGEKGIFTIHRDIVNKTFLYSGFTFLDLPPEQAMYEIKKKDASFAQRISLAVNYWLKSIIA